MKIGFYFDNSNISEVDLRYPENGNPGVGGTEYSFVQLARYLYLSYSDLDITIYTHKKSLLPDGLKVVIVKDIYDAVTTASNDNLNIFIFRPLYDSKLYKLIDDLKVNSITWGHNFYDGKLAKIINDTKYIKRNVFVGKQQYDRYIDHKICGKSTFIFNSFNSNHKEFFRTNDCKTVTYVGSLVPAKGFHVIAKEWSKILKSVPNAKLKVIGTGKVYSRDAKLGQYNLADEEYEKQFIKYLVDEGNKIHESVEFLGLLGHEKVKVYQNTSVGIVNPTAITETFGISAVEMEACGIPIVTKRKNGLLDTVLNGKTGILYKNEKNLADSVIKLLLDKKLNNSLGESAQSYVRHTFSPEIIIPQWYNLFVEVVSEVPATYIHPNNNWSNNMKWARVFNRKVKKLTSIESIPSMIDVESKIKELFF